MASPADGTLAQLFWGRVQNSNALPAQMVKRKGQWHTLTWAQVGEVVHRFALGLLALGRRRREAIALLSSSRAEWVQADFAILSAGCVTIPIYLTYTPEQVAYLVNDSQALTMIVEDPTQLAKVLEAWPRMSGLEQIVVIEGYDYITDRKKDLIVTSGGINIAPQAIENLLRDDPFIGQAMVYGDRRPTPSR